MIRSITADTKKGTVTYEYCKMHNEYPNCIHCPLLSSSGYCMDWLKEEVKHDD